MNNVSTFRQTNALQCIHFSVLTAISPGESGLASFIAGKDDGHGGDNWSYKTCKTTVVTTNNKHTPNVFVEALKGTNGPH